MIFEIIKFQKLNHIYYSKQCKNKIYYVMLVSNVTILIKPIKIHLFSKIPSSTPKLNKKSIKNNKQPITTLTIKITECTLKALNLIKKLSISFIQLLINKNVKNNLFK